MPLQRLLDRGVVITSHDPVPPPPAAPQLKGMDKDGVEEEVVGAREKLAECGIPEVGAVF